MPYFDRKYCYSIMSSVLKTFDFKGGYDSDVLLIALNKYLLSVNFL